MLIRYRLWAALNVRRIIRQTINTAKPAPARQGARKRFLLPRA